MTSNMIIVTTQKDGTERVSNIVLDKIEAWQRDGERLNIFVGMHIFSVSRDIDNVWGKLVAHFGDN
ncbi:MAG: hypothetical protein HOJ16_02420 [Candidatus Peribacter sp.]|jgi:hypothetical protein|nr:hypothetical protein [Candidatus Peribacter sp.]